MHNGKETTPLKKILLVADSQHNFIRISPLFDALTKKGKYEIKNVLTGQFNDDHFGNGLFEGFNPQKPNIIFEIDSQSDIQYSAKAMIEFETVLKKEVPDLVLISGDSEAISSCAFVAAKLLVPVAHVESGLRSGDREMPEEINRIVTDSISDLLFVSEPSGMHNLVLEGKNEERMFFVGNIMIDSLVNHIQKANESDVLERNGLESKKYTLITLHRPSNVDGKENLEKALRIFNEISHASKVVFPIHPRTRKRFEDFGLMEEINKNDSIILLEPQGYIEFLKLMKEAALVLTDSGGIQEETTVLGVPCLTMRENTERPVTITVGTNQLVGTEESEVKAKAIEVLSGTAKKGKIPEKWDGKTAERIVACLDAIYAE